MYGVQTQQLVCAGDGDGGYGWSWRVPRSTEHDKVRWSDRQRETVPIGQKRVIMAASIEGITRTSLAFPVTASVDGVKFGRNL